MNRLWVRLSIAFSSVVLIAVILVILTSILVSWINRPENFRPEFLRAPRGLVEELSAYYQRHNSWDGVDLVLGGAQSTFRAESGRGLILFLADENQRIMYPDRSGQIGMRLNQVARIQVISIDVDGRTVGYLGIAPRPSPPGSPDVGPSPPTLLERLRGFLLIIAIVGGAIGIIFGILMSRTLTAPLSRLAEGARAIGARNLTQRVEEKGTNEIVEVARAFNEMASSLEQAEQLRRNLLADVAHELRTPLSVLQGNLRAMLDEVYALDKTEVAGLYEQTRLLSRLVNDLHELAQAEAKQLPLNLKATDLTQLIMATSDTFSPVAEAEGITIQTELPADLPLIEVDEARLAQVLHNILGNGLRHTPTGGTIKVRAESTADAINLSISDTGEGIPPEHLSHIFDRFYRTDRARSRDRGGTGLGLAIARAIVEAHGGQIGVISNGVSGQGTTFTIHLPLRQS